MNQIHELIVSKAKKLNENHPNLVRSAITMVYASNTNYRPGGTVKSISTRTVIATWLDTITSQVDPRKKLTNGYTVKYPVTHCTDDDETLGDGHHATLLRMHAIDLLCEAQPDPDGILTKVTVTLTAMALHINKTQWIKGPIDYHPVLEWAFPTQPELAGPTVSLTDVRTALADTQTHLNTIERLLEAIKGQLES